MGCLNCVVVIKPGCDSSLHQNLELNDGDRDTEFAIDILKTTQKKFIGRFFYFPPTYNCDKTGYTTLFKDLYNSSFIFSFLKRLSREITNANHKRLT